MKSLKSVMNEKIRKKLGISELNAMQEAAADALLHTHKDVVILSPTGSGKTLAYLLPLVERLNPQSDEVQAVVVVPGTGLAELHGAQGNGQRLQGDEPIWWPSHDG